MVYKWKYNQPVPAEKAGKEMERIEAKHGVITPRILLNESRAETATLHRCFEWDDTVAAEKYRLRQAGVIINNLVVTIEECDVKEPVKAYVNIIENVPTKMGTFINIRSALQDEERRKQVLSNALRELKDFQRKYASLNELSKVFEEIRKLKDIA